MGVRVFPVIFTYAYDSFDGRASDARDLRILKIYQVYTL